MDLGPDLTPYEEEMPPAWQEMIDDVERAGGNIGRREAIRARIDIAITADRIMHDQYQGDVQRRHEKTLENRREAFQEKMASASEALQNDLDGRQQKRHDEQMKSAELDRAAQKTAAESAVKTAKALNAGTWVLAAATVVLVFVTATHGG